jgi:NAD(P)-dependent dehydrogenase (short-subunit alcohol dehydrogenase family)
VAEVVDHLDRAQVAALADRIAARFGRIDLLVNDIWGGELLAGDPSGWDVPLWELDLDAGLRMLRLAIDTHLVTSYHLLPLLVAQPGGLVVEVSDGTWEYNAAHYRISVFYDLAKIAVNRLAFSQGHELAKVGATAVCVTPGWMRSELMLEAFATTEATWRDAVGTTAPPDFAGSETTRFVGRGIAALAADADRARWNQRSVTAADLARAYGVTDVDGAQPDPWPAILAADPGAPAPE